MRVNDSVCIIFGVLAIAVFSLGARAAIETKKIENRIKMDGRLEEREWKDLPVHELSYSLSGKKPEVETWFRMGYDAQSLYLGFYCEQPRMDQIRAGGRGRDGAVWLDDGLGISIVPDRNTEIMYQFAFNADGELFDARRGDRVEIDWDARDVEVVTFKGESFWTAEFKLPIANVLSAKRQPGVDCKTWSINITRDYLGGLPRHISFSELLNYFDIASYSSVKGLDLDFQKWNWQIGEFVQTGFDRERGHAVCFFSLFNNTGMAFEELSLSVAAEGRQVGYYENLSLGNGGKRTFEIDVPCEGQGETRFRFVLFDKEGNLLAAEDMALLTREKPLELTITYPFYRNAIYATMDVSRLELLLDMHWPVEFAAKPTLFLKLLDAYGQVVSENRSIGTEKIAGQYELLVPELKPGEYTCRAELILGGNVLYWDERILQVYPPSSAEVRINEHLNFVVNGEEFFPLGTFHQPWNTEIADWCNSSILYRTAADLTENPAERIRLCCQAKAGRYEALFATPPPVWAHINVGKPELAKKPISKEHAKLIGDRAGQYKDQDGLLFWYMADEPLPDSFVPEYLEDLGDILRESDPYHPCYISYNRASAIDYYEKAADAVGVHWYLGFTERGLNFPMSSIVDQMKTARRLTRYRKAVIFSPQAFIFTAGQPETMRPVTHRESRCMAYLAIVSGAKGIIWYCTDGLRNSIQTRIGMPCLASELKALDRIFLAHEEATLEIAGKDSESLCSMAKVLDDHLYMIVVNSGPEAVRSILTLPDRWAVRDNVFEIASDDRIVKVNSNGRIKLKLEGYEVRIFTTDVNAPVVPSQESIEELFEEQERVFLASSNLCYGGGGARLRTSGDYGNLSYAKLAVNGYPGFEPETVKTAVKGSWLQVDFSEAHDIEEIVIYTGRNWGIGPLRDYSLEYRRDDRWLKVGEKVCEKSVGMGIRRVHDVNCEDAESIRIVLTRDMKEAGYLYEIQAFSKAFYSENR